MGKLAGQQPAVGHFWTRIFRTTPLVATARSLLDLSGLVAGPAAAADVLDPLMVVESAAAAAAEVPDAAAVEPPELEGGGEHPALVHLPREMSSATEAVEDAGAIEARLLQPLLADNNAQEPNPDLDEMTPQELGKNLAFRMKCQIFPLVALAHQRGIALGVCMNGSQIARLRNLLRG